MSSESLRVLITAEMSGIRAALSDLEGRLNKTKKAADGVGDASGLDGLNKKLSAAGKMALGLAASIGAAMSVQGLITASDEATTIAAKLKLATKSAEDFSRAQKTVYDISQRTRTSILATVDLYTRIERSTRAIGLNQATIARLTETINQAAMISGGGQGAEGALFQLGQALAAGALRGEELNSVLEGTPRLAEAIANGLDIPMGKLRELAAEGKLTTDQVLKAILSQQKAIADEAGKFPPTIAQGFTTIRNALIQYLQTSESAQSAAAGLANALITIANHLPRLIDLFIRLAPVAAAAWVAMWAAGNAAAITAFFTALPALVTASATSFTLLGAAATTALGRVKLALGVVIAAFAGWQLGTWARETFLEVELFGIALAAGLHKSAVAIKGSFVVTFEAIKQAAMAMHNFIMDTVADFADSVAKIQEATPGLGRMATVSRNLAAGFRSAKAETEGLGAAVTKAMRDAQAEIDAVEQGYAELAEAAIEAKQKAAAEAAGEVVIPSTPGTPDGKGSDIAAKLAATNAELVRDAVQRAIEQLDRLYAESKISARDYFAEKQRLEEQAIDASLQAAQAELRVAKGADEVAAANAKITILLRDREKAAKDAIEGQAKAEEELTRKLGQLHIRMLTATGETARATRLQLEEEMRELITMFEVNGDNAGANLARKVIDVEAWKSRIDQAKSVVSDAMRSFQDVQTSTGAQVQAGMMGQGDAGARVNEQREASLAQLVMQREELAKIKDEAILAGDAFTQMAASEALTQLDGQIAQLSINTESLGYKAAQVLQGSLTTLFEDLASGSVSAGDALKKFVLNFVQGMAQIAAQALATYLVLQMLDAIYPGLGKMTAATMGAAGHHSGGIAGAGGFKRQLPAFMFAGTPRYHTGGIAGLAPDEVPAVLKKGEEILTQQDPRHRYNGGAGGGGDRGRVTTPIVAIGDAAVANAMAGADGEDVIITHVRNNWDALTRG